MNNKPSTFKNRNVFQLQLRFNLFFFTLMKIVQWAIRIEICNCKCLTNQNHLRCSNTLRALFTDLRINVLQSKRLLKMSQSQKFDWSTLNRSLAPNLPLTHFPNGFTTSSCIILFYLDYLTTSSVPAAIMACLAVVRMCIHT